MKAHLSTILVVLALGAIAVFGQDKTAKPTPPAPTAKAASDSGAPTELERAKLENLQLRMALLNQEEQSLPQRKQEIQGAYGQLVQQIEREHPGYNWNPQTNGLVKTPPPAKAEPKK